MFASLPPFLPPFLPLSLRSFRDSVPKFGRSFLGSTVRSLARSVVRSFRDFVISCVRAFVRLFALLVRSLSRSFVRSFPGCWFVHFHGEKAVVRSSYFCETSDLTPSDDSVGTSVRYGLLFYLTDLSPEAERSRPLLTRKRLL